MSQHLLDLQPELREHIFNYCQQSDLLNIACCCKECYLSVKYILWRVVQIPWKTVEDQLPENKQLENLKYTSSLHFFANDYSCVLREKMWDYIFTKYNRILKYCNPDKLIILCLDSVINDHGLELTCNLLNKIQEISINWCYHITDDGLQYLLGLRHLRKISIQSSRIEDSGISKIVKISTLEEIHLSSCSCITASSLQNISNLINLKKLTLSHTKLVTSDGYIHLGKLHNLVELLLYRSTIRDSTLATVCPLLACLKVFKLHRCTNLTDIGVFHITAMSSLRTLSIIACTEVTNDGLLYFVNLTSLTELTICENAKISSYGFFYISSLKALKTLNCSWTNITDSALSSISTLSSLKKLNLSGCCKITDVGISNLSPLIDLEILEMTHCKELTDIGLFHVSTLKYLNELDISFCSNVSNIGLCFLDNLKLLKKLVVKGCSNVVDSKSFEALRIE